jgi:hypothetical protein
LSHYAFLNRYRPLKYLEYYIFSFFCWTLHIADAEWRCCMAGLSSLADTVTSLLTRASENLRAIGH